MSGNWITKALGKSEGFDKAISDASLDELVVILLQGRNAFGDSIFAYLQLTLRALHDLKAKLDASEDFKPSDYGTVLAAGKGEPDQQLKDEMLVKYQLVDVAQPPPKPVSTAQPRFWGDDE